jgi:polyhydroxyalkanoate synthesis regulator phasin
MRIARWAFTILLIAPLAVAVSARAQEQQDDSLAAAARRAQEKKAQQTDSTKPAKVWDNDNLPDKPGAINVIGPEGQPSTGANDASNPPAAANSAPTPEDKSAIQGDLLSDKGRLESLKADLDVMQRKYALDQQTYYGKTNYAADKDGAAALASEKEDIDAKQDEVTALEKQVAELQSKLDAASKDQPAAAK